MILGSRNSRSVAHPAPSWVVGFVATLLTTPLLIATSAHAHYPNAPGKKGHFLDEKRLHAVTHACMSQTLKEIAQDIAIAQIPKDDLTVFLRTTEENGDFEQRMPFIAPNHRDWTLPNGFPLQGDLTIDAIYTAATGAVEIRLARHWFSTQGYTPGQQIREHLVFDPVFLPHFQYQVVDHRFIDTTGHAVTIPAVNADDARILRYSFSERRLRLLDTTTGRSPVGLYPVRLNSRKYLRCLREGLAELRR